MTPFDRLINALVIVLILLMLTLGILDWNGITVL
jgi:hypothetical protein